MHRSAAKDIELVRGALHEIVAGLPELAFASDEVHLEALLALDARLQRVESVEAASVRSSSGCGRDSYRPSTLSCSEP